MRLAIVDASYNSEKLAKSIFNAAERTVETLSSRSETPFYVIGNAADFDEFCERIVESIPTTGVACLWPKISANSFYKDTASVHFQRYYVQPVPEAELDVLLVQSIVAVSDEILAMLSLVLGSRRPRSITIACCTLGAAARSGIKSFAQSQFELQPEFLSMETLSSDIDPIEFENLIYDRLDTREQRIVPVMPHWVLGQIRGTKLDKTQDPALGGPTI